MINCYCSDCQRAFKGRAAAQGGEDGFALVVISAMCPYCGEFIVDWKGKIPIVSDPSVIFDPEIEKKDEKEYIETLGLKYTELETGQVVQAIVEKRILGKREVDVYTPVGQEIETASELLDNDGLPVALSCEMDTAANWMKAMRIMAEVLYGPHPEKQEPEKDAREKESEIYYCVHCGEPLKWQHICKSEDDA